MKVKLKNETVLSCNSPTEQKIFRSGDAAGWILSLGLLKSMTSDEADLLITSENFSKLLFLSDEDEELFGIDGYEKVASVIIRHSDEAGSVDIQLTKPLDKSYAA